MNFKQNVGGSLGSGGGGGAEAGRGVWSCLRFSGRREAEMTRPCSLGLISLLALK